MKKTTMFAALLFCLVGKAQVYKIDTATVRLGGSLGIGISNSRPDTSACIMLVTECDTCVARAVRGYSINQFFQSTYLNQFKQPFAPSVTVWAAFIKPRP